MPLCLSLLICIVWYKVSNALDRSKNIEIGSFSLTSVCSKVSTNSMVAVSVECCFIKPCWLPYNS